MLLQKVRLSSFLWQCSIPLCKWTTVFYPLIYWWSLGYFQILAIVNNTAINIGMHIFFPISVSCFIVYIPRSGIAGSKDKIIFNFFKLIWKVWVWEEREREWERICCSPSLCIHCLILVCQTMYALYVRDLTKDQICNLGVWGRLSNQQSYLARTPFLIFWETAYCFPQWLHQSAFPAIVPKDSLLCIFASTCCLLIYW